MRVALLGRWNATCGVSLHGELIGRELLRRGYSLRVFAPLPESAGRWWHHKIVRRDEEFVRRVYTELSPEGEEGHLDPEDVLSEQFDLLLVESYEKLPYRDVEELVRRLRERGIPAVAVIHESCSEDLRYSNLALFSALVVFDERYLKEVLGERAKGVRVEILPYPCLPVREGSRRFAEDGRIVFFSFGRQPVGEYRDFLHVLRKLREDYPRIVYRVVRAGEPLGAKEEWIFEEQKVLDLEEIYALLHSSDVHLLPKGRTNRVVVSSTLSQTLGSLCITVAPDTRFFETLPRGEEAPVVLYRDSSDLELKLRELLNSPELRERIRENARRFVEENSLPKVADGFLKLFDRLSP